MFVDYVSGWGVSHVGGRWNHGCQGQDYEEMGAGAVQQVKLDQQIVFPRPRCQGSSVLLLLLLLSLATAHGSDEGRPLATSIL